jgi:hypothetical protein
LGDGFFVVSVVVCCLFVGLSVVLGSALRFCMTAMFFRSGDGGTSNVVGLLNRGT